MASFSARFTKASESLTLRGKCLIAAGLTCCVVAFPLSEPDLLRVGLFLLIVPLVGLVVVTRTKFRIACARQLSAPRVAVGGATRVDLQLRNDSRVPTTVMMLEDQVPYALGAKPRFVIDRLEPAGTRRVNYELEPGMRGKYRIGPLALTLADPFGCVAVAHEFSSSQDLVVTPPITPLPQLRYTSARAHTGEYNARVLSAVGEVDIGTREYRHGDDLRKIHWRSTARTGELMVRQEQAGRTSRACLLLDTRASAHRGDPVTGSFEWSVAAVASMLVHLGSNNQPVELIGAFANGTGAPLPSSLDGAAAQAVHMDRLAQVSASEHERLRPELALMRSRAIECGSLFAVVGNLSSDDLHALMPLGKVVPAAHIVLVDVSSWETLGNAQAKAATTRALTTARRSLAAAGWKVAVAHRGDTIAEPWSRLGEGG